MTNSKYVDLHVHDLSLKDSYMDVQQMIKRLKELGRKGMASTNHGTLSSIEDLRRIFKEEGLKFVPGVELYIDGKYNREHLILLAKNDNGYFKGISKVVTASNYHLKAGFPVITKEELFSILEPVKNDVYVLSGCMQGVVCSILLQNKEIEKKVLKLQRTQEKCTSPYSKTFVCLKEKIEQMQEEIQKIKREKERLSVLASMKFVAREKKVLKAEKNGDEKASELRKAFEDDKVVSENAKLNIKTLDEELISKTTVLSGLKKDFKKLSDDVIKYDSLDLKIKDLKGQLLPEEQLYKLALKEAETYKKFFNKNFYMEIQYHNIPEEAKCFPQVASIAKELGIPLVATNDCHTIDNSSNELLKRQILRSIRSNKWVPDEIGDKELYFKTEEEMRDILSLIFSKEVIEEAILNTSIIFDNCNVDFKMTKNYPVFSKTEDAKDILDKEVSEGIKTRFPKGFPVEKEKEYQERLAYELNIIKSMGYADYHLIVKDYIEYGRLLGFVPKKLISTMPLSINELKKVICDNEWTNRGMTIGPGRGSAAGSLVCYCLGITNLDPIKYGLLFERFLNPERVSMPDIDVDFSKSIREQCIRYVKAKYGEKAVCGIMTKNSQAPKGVIRIAAKYYGLSTIGEPYTSLGDTIAKQISSEVGVSFSSTVNKTGKLDKDSKVTLYEYLCDVNKSDNIALMILKWAKCIEGLFTAYSSHAAGIVIAGNGDVSDCLPLKWNEDLGMMTTQCDMVQVEENGLLKFDFLGLKTLDIITDASKLIEKNYGKNIDFLKINVEDEKVFTDIFSKGKTDAVFQFESNGMKKMLKRFKPACFEDLIILVSMFRPGPLQFIDDVIDVKNGKKKMTFLCPELESILAPTYGAICYQEQVMMICQKLAGFTMGHSDNVRKYMSKKKVDKLAHEKDEFVDGCVNNGIDSKIAETIFSQMMDFAKYAFNKSHAACYAFLAYITAWIKYYYPAEFFASALNYTNYKKLPNLMGEAKNMGIDIIPPSINLANNEFIVADGKIVFGLSMVKGVGVVADDIIREREKNGTFLDIKDFLKRIKKPTAIISLVKAGAFDEFNANRTSVINYMSEISPLIEKIKDKNALISCAKVVLSYIEKNNNVNADDIIKVQEDAGLNAKIKDVLTSKTLEKKVLNAEKSLLNLTEELDTCILIKYTEDRKERMKNEYELLGSYITMHPIDIYPAAKELNVKTIDEGYAASGKTEIYGIIKDLRITKRKSDGAEMAFFTLTDRTADIEVCIFTKSYKLLSESLVEGNAYIIKGKYAIKETENEDEDEEIYQFIAESVKAVKEKKFSYMISVSSYAMFHLDIEDSFRGEYEDAEDGHDLYIYDKSLNEMRKADYKVSDKCKIICKELSI